MKHIPKTRDNADRRWTRSRRIKTLLLQIAGGNHECGDRLKYTKNGSVVSVGGYVKPLSSKAKSTAKKMGEVFVEMGEAAYKANEDKNADNSEATDNTAENKEDVVDADFEEVKDNEEKKDAS